MTVAWQGIAEVPEVVWEEIEIRKLSQDRAEATDRGESLVCIANAVQCAHMDNMD